MNNWDELINDILGVNPLQYSRSKAAALRSAIDGVVKERDELQKFVDKFIGAHPETNLEKRVHEAEAALKAANDAANEMIRQWHIWGSQTAGQGLPTSISNSIAEYELVLQELHCARVAKDGE